MSLALAAWIVDPKRVCACSCVFTPFICMLAEQFCMTGGACCRAEAEAQFTRGHLIIWIKHRSPQLRVWDVHQTKPDSGLKKHWCCKWGCVRVWSVFCFVALIWTAVHQTSGLKKPTSRQPICFKEVSSCPRWGHSCPLSCGSDLHYRIRRKVQKRKVSSFCSLEQPKTIAAHHCKDCCFPSALPRASVASEKVLSQSTPQAPWKKSFSLIYVHNV